ncbi:hypothetical protein GF373_00055 [bacterium]|nr:hypothetical protein [bacterium]
MDQQIRFNEALAELNSLYAEAAQTTKDGVALAVQMVNKWDADMEASILEKDQQVEQLENDLHEKCFHILALHQPMAIDLRYIMSILAVIIHIKAISERAAKIAKRVKQMIDSSIAKDEIPYNFTRMEEKVQEILNKALDAVPQKTIKESDILAGKELVEGIHRQHRAQKFEGINKDPKNASPLDRAWSISNHLKNMTDEIREITSEIVFLETGEYSAK